MRINGNIVDAVYEDVMKTRNFIMPIYKARVTFAVGKDLKKMFKILGIHTSDTKYDGYGAFTVRAKEDDGHYRYFLIVKKGKGKIALTDLNHEVMHFSIVICEDRGIKIEAWNDEPIAYIAEYVMRKFLKFLGIKNVVNIK